MSVQVGDKAPSGVLRRLGDGIEALNTDELFAGRKVVLFAVPGAFTPTCNDTHVPGFMVNADKIKAKGVDAIYCMASNDPFVAAAWAKSLNADGVLEVLSDGNGDYAEALGQVLDLTAIGLGKRSGRFALVIDDGTVTYFGVEPGKEVTVSGAEAVLAAL